MTDGDKSKRESDHHKALALYIVSWLERRNGSELAQALDEQRVADRRNMLGELEMILKHGGHPPNWEPLK